MTQILTHWTDKKFKIVDRGEFEIKPNGFWISVDNSWERWLKGNWDNWLKDKICLKIELAKDIKLFVIESKEQFLKKFKELMGYDFSGLRLAEQFEMKEFHNKLKEYYDGAWLLSKPFYAHRLDLDFSYFYSWDCESICVWNKNKIKFTEVKE